jgi:hypothetical protein
VVPPVRLHSIETAENHNIGKCFEANKKESFFMQSRKGVTCIAGKFTESFQYYKSY